MAEAIFLPQGEHFVPTAHAAGPWSPDALHGGATAALMARAIEAVGPGQDMFVSRMSVELVRPVPMAPLGVTTSILRPGKKVQLIEARVSGNGDELARATALRIRKADIDLPELMEVAPAPPPGPDSAGDSDGVKVAGLGRAMHIRFVRGDFVTSGPSTAWFRLRYPVVAGEEPSPLMRLMAAADFGNGISHMVDFFKYLFINPDLTVYLHRLPEGEWICLDAVTYIGSSGVGMAESLLWDESGPVGRAVQSLLIDSRPG